MNPQRIAGSDASAAAVSPNSAYDHITARWAALLDRIAAACALAHRNPSEVTVVAVAKKHPAEAVLAASKAGIRHIGENYVQELNAKRAQVDAVTANDASTAPLQWHFIGHLQRNKAKEIAGRVALVHAVDSAALAQSLAKYATQVQPVLIAVNLAAEASKSGIAAQAAPALAREILAMPRLRLDGLMTMPPPDLPPAQTRAFFAQLRALRDALQQQLGCHLPVLSMGMSDDFELAIAEGATHVRIGTALFGARPQASDATASTTTVSPSTTTAAD